MYDGKLNPACGDSKHENFLNFFHLVNSMGPNKWENSHKPCNLGLLTKSTTLLLLDTHYSQKCTFCRSRRVQTAADF